MKGRSRRSRLIYSTANDANEPMNNITADHARNLLENIEFAYFLEENMVKRDFKKTGQLMNICHV